MIENIPIVVKTTAIWATFQTHIKIKELYVRKFLVFPDKNIYTLKTSYTLEWRSIWPIT